MFSPPHLFSIELDRIQIQIPSVTGKLIVKLDGHQVEEPIMRENLLAEAVFRIALMLAEKRGEKS